jgi:hypothetical protein
MTRIQSKKVMFILPPGEDAKEIEALIQELMTPDDVKHGFCKGYRAIMTHKSSPMRFYDGGFSKRGVEVVSRPVLTQFTDQQLQTVPDSIYDWIKATVSRMECMEREIQQLRLETNILRKYQE